MCNRAFYTKRAWRVNYLSRLPIVAEADDGHLARLDDANELLHPSTVLIAGHSVHLIHNHHVRGQTGRIS